MRSSARTLPEGHGSLYKEPAAIPPRAHNSRIPPPTYPAFEASYLDQSRALLESQRANFEAERALFAQERQLWEKERSVLKSRIAELESLLKGQGVSVTTSTVTSPQPVFGTPQYNGTTGTLDGGLALTSAQVWEGSSPGGRPTRVFLEAEIPDPSHLPPILEGSSNNPPSLDAALSSQFRASDPSGLTGIPVPIEKLDSRLDGITLKSTALPPGIVARVITPPSPSPLENTSSPATALSPGSARPSAEHRNSLKLKLSELSHPSENLVRDAGHTPMAVIEGDPSQRTTQEASPTEKPEEEGLFEGEEAPLAPTVTKSTQPIETSDSYFPDLPDDPALKGPLGLTNDEKEDNSFLTELDQKLLDQARRILSTSSGSGGDPNETDPEDLASQGEADPEIKFKNSTNFGTAFGLSNCGEI
ncbi:hypothetical protein N7510_003245 [Penicillium lagena]|uniref:uncharacterized protein n=1 Tax=Penicillium lagena TaxID=94218 RepID=UPI0025418675|nr:uncharacterized protein N7510_003245 [Penicillium lagena]KAJ5619261.1 hypothetical protein N7510_003245 [Penicillium lagena]